MVKVVKLEKVPEDAYFLGYDAWDETWNPNVDPDTAIREGIKAMYESLGLGDDVTIGYLVYRITQGIGRGKKRYLYSIYSLSKNYRPIPGYLKEEFGI